MKLLTVTLLSIAPAIVAPQPALARTVKGDCSITVDGKAQLDLKKTCAIDVDAGGSFSIGTGRPGAHFAYVSVNGDGTAEASWNDDRRDTHAHSPLGGDFTRQGACWVNRRARICARTR